MSTTERRPVEVPEAPSRTGAVVLVCATAALGGFLFGYDTAVINGAVDAVRAQFGMSAGLTGFVVSSALIGAGVGAWFAGPLADRIRATALAVAAAAQWAANWLVSTTFLPLADVGLGFTYGLYTGFAALALLFVLRAIKETKGRELEDM